MANLKKFKSIEEEVISILIKDKKARENDMRLYYTYCISKGIGQTYFSKVFEDEDYRRGFGIAPYESVSRIRRKVQKAHEELRASDKKQKEKKEAEIDYMAYFKERIG